ncbi:uncharacterized protein LOC108677148 [Hyalella azteca]|uniref:Uncharacterized protein LOC108677148 n=1 Tax=Hyalella azteca TaxID=294128 RepID=A0A8B7P6Q5_HYAAZ|nr:uncharacterized protein LOC108677148 [Hyalella azteca]
MEVEVPTTTEVEESTDKVPIEAPSDETNKENETADEPKKNGTLAGVAAAAAASAAKAAAAAANKAEETHSNMNGVVLQFPEMFSLKRDRHILQKFEDAHDIRMQKCAFVECESEEAAVALQAKLNNSNLGGKKVLASRLDITEKNVLYIGSLKPETTDEMIRTLLPGIEEIRREKYNTFVLFSSESECRAARAKVIKDGIYGQRLHCDFDFKGKDRFKVHEEPSPKKPKEDTTSEEKKTEDNCDEESEENKAEERESKENEESDVKADEW